MPGLMQKLRMPIQTVKQLPHRSLQWRDGMSLWQVLPLDHLTHLFTQSA
jgi:hypothetical protein